MTAESQGGSGCIVRLCRSGLVLAVVLAASACGGGGFLKKAETDPDLLTSGVGSGTAVTDPNLAQDQATIRNVVTAVDTEEMAGNMIAWSNPATGSRGQVTGITEYTDQGALCRRYEVTRESFDGVNLFNGETCFGPNRVWLSRSFAANP